MLPWLTLAALLPVVEPDAKPTKWKKVPPAREFVRTPSELDRKILDAMACANTPTAGAIIGIHVVQLRTGKVLHQTNSQNQFVPASNTKLFSTALALSRLGPSHTFTTRLAADCEPNEQGVLRGDVLLIGGGDPTLASRRYAQSTQTVATEAIDQLTQALLLKGVRHITGAIVGDETYFPHDPYPIGWTLDDSLADFGAPVSALTIHDNVQSFSVSPWSVRASPAVDYFTIFHQVKASNGEVRDEIRTERFGRQLILTGSAPADRALTHLVALDDPALFAATALHEALRAKGVRIDEAPRVRLRRAGEPLPEAPKVDLYQRTSPPLIEILRIIDKTSMNLYAEIVLREVARVQTGEGTRRAAAQEMSKFIWQTGANGECCYFQDGSGLSRQTLVTPAAVTKLLAYMYHHEHRDAWLSLLPVGASDGTLSRRFAEEQESANRIRAKTGSLTHVSALSGYALGTKKYGDVAFSILTNNYNGTPAEIHRIIDKIAVAIAEE